MRLITRGDLDGLACAVVITECEDISEVVLVHPQDVTDDRIEIQSDDILANLPYHPDCGTWFDHHLISSANRRPEGEFNGRYALADSAAELVMEHYKDLGHGEKLQRFAGLISETNRLDAAKLVKDDVLDPEGYILLGFTIDSRTGLGAFEEYFHHCTELVKTKPIGEVLQDPQVADRVERLRARDLEFREALTKCSRVEGNVVVTDFRDYDKPPVGNRFLIYTLYPSVNVSLRIHWGPERKFAVAAVGHSIFERTCNTNVGELLGRYGGGGHRGAGSVPIPTEEADAKLAEILDELQKNG